MHSRRIDWLLSLVDENRPGVFVLLFDCHAVCAAGSELAAGLCPLERCGASSRDDSFCDCFYRLLLESSHGGVEKYENEGS